MDYSFTGVNEASLQLAPKHAMQLDHALPRLLQRIAYADHSHGPPLLMKLDLSDGYYRVHLSPEAALELAVVFTETVADMANHALNNDQRFLPPPVENLSQDHDVPRLSSFAPNIVMPQACSSLT